MRFGFWEIILILLLVFLLFGMNRFPEMMKHLADGLKVFKKELGVGAADSEKKKPGKGAAKKPGKKKK